MQGVATRGNFQEKDLYASMAILQQARSYFYEAFKSRDGPWTMAFAALASGYALRKQAIILLEGKRQVTATVARDVLTLFPADEIHTEHLGPDAMVVQDFSTVRIVQLPGIDVKPARLDCFEHWEEKDGYIYEYLSKRPRGEKVRETKQFGKVVVLATCESASGLPSWLKDLAWLIPVSLTDEQSEASIISRNAEFTIADPIPPITGSAVDAVIDPKATIQLGLRTLPVVSAKIPFIDAIPVVLETCPQDVIVEDAKIKVLLAGTCVLDASRHHVFMEKASGERFAIAHPDDLDYISHLVSPLMRRLRALKPIERQLLEKIQDEASTGTGWLPTAQVIVAMKACGVVDKTIRRMLDQLVVDGYLLKDVGGRGAANSFKIAGAVNLDKDGIDDLRRENIAAFEATIRRLKYDEARFKELYAPVRATEKAPSGETNKRSKK